MRAPRVSVGTSALRVEIPPKPAGRRALPSHSPWSLAATVAVDVAAAVSSTLGARTVGATSSWSSAR